MHGIVVVAVLATLALVGAARAPESSQPSQAQRIVGGNLTAIEQYPYAAFLFYTQSETTYSKFCAGVILNARSVLTSANCIFRTSVTPWRIRIGSVNANLGGAVHRVAQLRTHPTYSTAVLDYDIGLVRSATIFDLNGITTDAAYIAGVNYNVPDNVPVWAIGWGAIAQGGSSPQLLRHVQMQTMNWWQCGERYIDTISIIDSMMCAGRPDGGQGGQCPGDTGSPLVHDGVVVGVYSYGIGCNTSMQSYPAVNARVDKVSNWIVNNA